MGAARAGMLREGLAAGLRLLLHPRRSSLAQTAANTSSGAVNPLRRAAGRVTAKPRVAAAAADSVAASEQSGSVVQTVCP